MKIEVAREEKTTKKMKMRTKKHHIKGDEKRVTCSKVAKKNKRVFRREYAIRKAHDGLCVCGCTLQCVCVQCTVHTLCIHNAKRLSIYYFNSIIVAISGMSGQLIISMKCL